MQEEQTLLRFRTRDEFLVHAYLAMPSGLTPGAARGVPILLLVHGSLGHFLARGTPRLLPHALLERGFASLSINTRLATVGQMTSLGVFDDSVHDIEAAMAFLTDEGFRNVFVLGYSLGAAMVVHWAAMHKNLNVRGLVLEGIGYSIPDRHRRNTTQWGATPSYDAIYQKARAVLGDDPRNSCTDETFVQYQSRGPTRQPNHSEIFTYKTWWHLHGPEAYAAMAHRHVRAIELPMLLIRGEHDEIVEDWEPVELALLARAAGNRHVGLRQIPRAGHDCMENADVMLTELAHFVSAHVHPRGP
jgi:pimeloyl-ACP methyl ester carboxylesterase